MKFKPEQVVVVVSHLGDGLPHDPKLYPQLGELAVIHSTSLCGYEMKNCGVYRMFGLECTEQNVRIHGLPFLYCSFRFKLFVEGQL